jgi:hypothetical protein
MADAAKLRLCPGGAPAVGLTLVAPAAPATASAPAATGAPPPPPAAASHRRALLAAAPGAAPARPPPAPPGVQVLGVDGRRAAVTGMDNMCGGGTLFFVDRVPLPCELPAIRSDAEVDALLARGSSAPANAAAAPRCLGAALLAAAPLLAAAAAAAAAAL